MDIRENAVKVYKDTAWVWFGVIFFTVMMAWVIYLLAKRIFPEGKTRWLFCLAITYQPMNLFIMRATATIDTTIITRNTSTMIRTFP